LVIRAAKFDKYWSATNATTDYIGDVELRTQREKQETRAYRPSI